MNTDAVNKTPGRIIKYGFKRIAFLLILVLWAIYTYSTGNRLLGALILVFIFLILFNIPYIVPAAVLAFMLILFQTPLVSTGGAIIESYTTVLGNPGQALSNLFTPASGQAGLPRAVGDQPPVLLLSYTGCFTIMKWFELLREQFKRETIMLHTPYMGDGRITPNHH